jgi:hypothetical protein
LEGVAALTPSGNIVIVLQNRDEKQTYKLEINDPNRKDQAVKVSVGPKSIKTVVWKNAASTKDEI